MRRMVMFVLMINLCLLSSCGDGGKDEEMVNIIMQELAAAASVEAQAVISAPGEEYELKCTVAGEEGEIEVISPELISGVKAKLSGEELSLSYGDVVISAGALNSEGLEPVSMLPCVISTLRQGWLMQVWRETYMDTECIVAQYRISDDGVLRVWLEPDIEAPLYAELESSGEVKLSCRFISWIRG